jgi:RNA polymerase sigma-70 factor (ECF subfamily)
VNENRQTAERFLGLLRPIERELEVYCRRLVFEAADAPDAIQNTVLRAFRAFDRYHDDASFRAWMFKILTNECFALNRQRGRIAKFEVPVEPEEMDAFQGDEPPAWTERVSSWEMVADALDEELVASLAVLNENERAVLLLRAVGDLRYREISDALEIPLGSVMGHLARARQKMRAAILRAHRPARRTQADRRTAP